MHGGEYKKNIFWWSTTGVIEHAIQIIYAQSSTRINLFFFLSQHAAHMKFKKDKSSTESHWLDHAVSSRKFERSLVQDIKALGNLLVLYLPCQCFGHCLSSKYVA